MVGKKIKWKLAHGNNKKVLLPTGGDVMWVLIDRSYHKHTLVYVPIKKNLFNSVTLVHYSIMSAKS